MNDTPLSRWLRLASDQERDRLALLAGTSRNYLYQIAACRREPRVGLAFRIEAASRKLWAETEGRLAIVTAEEMAQACALEGL
jgi:hypothetical protein